MKDILQYGEMRISENIISMFLKHQKMIRAGPKSIFRDVAFESFQNQTEDVVQPMSICQ